MGVVISALRQCLQPDSPGFPDSPVREIPLSSITIEIIGEVKFKDGSAPDVLPANSHLEVRFEDVSKMDAPSVKIGETVVDVTDIYKKGKPLMYSIACLKPVSMHDRYGVSAILNLGWKPNAEEWIRKGDYLDDYLHYVELKDGKDFYKADIEVKKYQ